MEFLNILDAESVNKTFCNLVGIRPIYRILKNLDTEEERFYTSRTGGYKYPRNWRNVKSIVFKTPIYPDFTNPVNFLQLLDLHWRMFGNLGGMYNKIADESFALNFLFNKTKAILAMKSYGGSDILELFSEGVRNIDFYLEENHDNNR